MLDFFVSAGSNECTTISHWTDRTCRNFQWWIFGTKPYFSIPEVQERIFVWRYKLNVRMLLFFLGNQSFLQPLIFPVLETLVEFLLFHKIHVPSFQFTVEQCHHNTGIRYSRRETNPSEPMRKWTYSCLPVQFSF